MAISDDFKRFVVELSPRFAFNPGVFDEPNDLFVAAYGGDGNPSEQSRSGWDYVGTPGSEAHAFKLMARTVDDAFAAQALAKWLQLHPELRPERDVFGAVHYR
jgi:hypothetical protein